MRHSVILILFFTSSFLGCSDSKLQEEIQSLRSENSKLQDSIATLTKKLSRFENLSSKNPTDPSSALLTFAEYYKKGQYDSLLCLTASSSIKEFGKSRILECYKKMDFLYDMKYLNSEQDGKYIIARYETVALGMKVMSVVRFANEDGKLKIVLRSLDPTWARCIQDGV